jgi:Holliday junction resolvase|tara:strand:- start:596 stop:1000 length:405 start_codon:yes stop_codon:yes gene_type:complete
MSNQTESSFWKQIKTGLSSTDAICTRIENSSTQGIPDLLLLDRAKDFHLIELKVVKGNKVLLSPHQVSFATRHAGARSWIVAKKDDTVYLYRSDQAIAVFEDGIRCPAHGTFTKPIDWSHFLTTIETRRVPLEP